MKNVELVHSIAQNHVKNAQLKHVVTQYLMGKAVRNAWNEKLD
mgnify:FL=1